LIELVDHSTVELIKHNASDEDVAYAAWVSNFADEARNRDTSRIDGLINFLYSNKHMSPFEHGSFTFFVDTPIFVAREFMRHRTFSYNETSGRYKELSPRFYMPPKERPLVQQGKVGAYTFVEGSEAQIDKVRDFQTTAFSAAWNAYQRLLEDGIAKEVARNVLPVATMTQFYATANPRNIMQFLVLRNDKHALYEIRKVAVDIEKSFADAMPLTYAAFTKARDEDSERDSVINSLRNEVAELRAEIERLETPTTLHAAKRKDKDFVVNVSMDDYDPVAVAREVERVTKKLKDALRRDK
jgi:thymidylate synthase (FAD)